LISSLSQSFLRFAIDSFRDHGAVLDVAWTKAFSADKWSVLGRTVLRICALNAMYTWMCISKLGAKFRRRARSRSSLLHVKRLRCVVAGKVLDETFRGNELRPAPPVGIGSWSIMPVRIADVPASSGAASA